MAILRVCCFDRADFLFAAIEKRVTALFSWALSFDALYPPKNDMVVGSMMAYYSRDLQVSIT